jgi:hypothetical protein
VFFFKCGVEVGVEESIVNASLVSLQTKNTNNAKSEIRFKQLIRGGFTIDFSTPASMRNLNELKEVLQMVLSKLF